MKWGANSFRQLWLGVVILPVAVHVASAAQKETAFSISPQATELLESYCFDCHGADSKKGDVQLDDLVGLSLKDRLELLNRAQEQLFTKRMPPQKKKTQPSETERRQPDQALRRPRS